MATNYIAGLFAKSPIHPLQEHMYCVYQCIQNLTPLLDGLIEEDREKIEQAHKNIIDGEHAADRMKKDLRHHLPKGLFMPIDRRDVLDVLLMQDAIANQAKDIAGLIVGRNMSLPQEMHEKMIPYGALCVETVKQALGVTNTLDELLETGFRGREVDHVELMIEELNRSEGETDKLQKELRQVLFSMEDDLRATDVMFTYRLIEWIGRIADDAQKVGSRLQLMLAR
ncbi:MAG: Phosphate transport regulator (distant homolog of PhoU) [uncultured Thiotrichaceae bacterium]|uniref:Phosphate transport regulator (Distant homolog of PhoU) n=1 Tax=uncultured Thiotrichaceae bacterium TaxID=298394 RepID=A0A6S6STP9_9GAMM|nr:MAG: Phosphate transport regulator (distant homolog of PhoU) [uncultured Thiotrichaceae bacterium]